MVWWARKAAWTMMGEPPDFLINSIITGKYSALYREKTFLSSSDDYKEYYRCLTNSNSNSYWEIQLITPLSPDYIFARNAAAAEAGGAWSTRGKVIDWHLQEGPVVRAVTWVPLVLQHTNDGCDAAFPRPPETSYSTPVTHWLCFLIESGSCNFHFYYYTRANCSTGSYRHRIRGSALCWG